MGEAQKIWINAGEISGDMHGASLIRALRTQSPELELLGMGGPEMRASGFESIFQVENLSVMGLTEVLGQLPKILRLLKNIEERLRAERPDAIVVIDSPDFHFRLIKAARRLGIPVYYYISPKLWAWRQGRARFIQQNVRRLLSILPFEVNFYKKFGMTVDYVGNPLMDQLDLPMLDKVAKVPGRIGFMPGSRRKEVSSLMAEFGAAARELLALEPSLEFHCAVAPGMTREFLASFWPADIPLTYREPDERYVFMRECQALIAASGTATLESALIGTPTVITYKVSPLSFFIGKLVVKVPYIGLANLIAGREILPEVLQKAANGANLAAITAHWLKLPTLPAPGPRFKEEIEPKLRSESGDLNKVHKNLAALRVQVGGPGAAGRAAEVILSDLATL